MGQKSGCSLAGCLWLQVPHENAVKLSAAVGFSSEGPDGGEWGSASRLTHVVDTGLSLSPHGPLYKAASQHGSWLPPGQKNARECM